MRRIDVSRHFLCKFWEKLSNKAVRRKPIGLFPLKIFFSNDAGCVDIEVPGMRHPFLFSGGLSVQDLEHPNDLGIWIGQKREINLVPVSKILQYRRTIVANSRQCKTVLRKLRLGALQLNQLRFAERSPVRRSEEQEDGPIGSTQRLT